MISQQKTTLTQRIKSFPLKSNNNSNINSYMDGNGSEMENLLDVESALQPHMSTTNIFTKKQATMSFISEGKTSHEFDQFIIVLTIIGIVSLILGFFSLSGVGILVISFALLSCIVSFWYCSYYVKWIMSQKPGTQDMKIIADYIKVGANAYLKTQYLTIAYYAIFTCIAIFVIYLFRENILGNDEIKISTFTIGLLTSISFLVGAVCSALAGYTGVWTSVRCNLRVASAASKMDYINSFLLSFRGGAVSSILSASMCILGISSLYILFNLIFVRIYGINESNVPLLLGGYGFGASFVALFMQLGGGIYTKAADVGADMCGKIEKGIPEDDPRNPAVIADLVGDNVGDCAGSMADVFESISGEMIGTMILGGTLCKKANLSDNTISLFIYFPLIIHSLDLIVSMIGIYFTKPKTQNEDAIIPMKRGYTISLVLAIILYFIVCKFMLDYNPETNTVFIHYGLCGIVGLLCAYCLVLITQYYTDYTHSPVKKISKASKTGHGTNIIAGISVGMESTGLPVIVISISLLISYKLGYSSGITYDINNISFDNGNMIPDNLDELNLEIQHLAGLFGTACATMGMLCTAVFVLSMNNFGPIADNAGGVVEMSEQPHEVRVITDRLDAVGNVTKAATKGYAVGGSALACFLLFNAFLDDITVISNTKFKVVDITKIEVMISGLIGIMMVFLFVGWSISAVGHTAEDVVTEVRRQFREIPGLMQGKNKPNYKRCVEIVTKAALDKMKKPALLALLTPIFVGVLFRFIGDIYNLDNSGINLLGVECLSSFLIFGTLTGLLMAIFLDNSGGAWDNAKKLIESKNLKNTYEHSSAITGDTVGDPFKDTAGPSLDILIKLMTMMGLLFVREFETEPFHKNKWWIGLIIFILFIIIVTALWSWMRITKFGRLDYSKVNTITNDDDNSNYDNETDGHAGTTSNGDVQLTKLNKTNEEIIQELRDELKAKNKEINTLRARITANVDDDL